MFFKNFPKETFRYGSIKDLKVMDDVLFITGPDTGKTGRVIDIVDSKNIIVKFDSNGLSYQEVKNVGIEYLGKVIKNEENNEKQ